MIKLYSWKKNEDCPYNSVGDKEKTERARVTWRETEQDRHGERQREKREQDRLGERQREKREQEWHGER